MNCKPPRLVRSLRRPAIVSPAARGFLPHLIDAPLRVGLQRASAASWQRRSLVWMFVASGLLAIGHPVHARGETESASDPQKVEFFEKKIRPALVTHCFKCHGENPEKIRGGLVLTDPLSLAAGGDTGPVLVPGDPANSLLMEALEYKNQDLQMPPIGKLPDRVIQDFERWIRDGAIDPRPADSAAPRQMTRNEAFDFTAGREHWAYQAMVDHPPPQVRHTAWVQRPLDKFVLARLEAAGLHPVARADKRTLIRRATYVLTGLPPTPAEIADFLADESPAAFARVVDRLLASPHYGERWARHWLDVARYADSNGVDENVGYPYSFKYRDYVIRALNADKPYDRFVREQLAGDLLQPANDDEAYFDQLMATGFLMVGPKVLAEQDREKFRMDIVDEQLDVTAKALMGQTLGCARCHDHKFDPIPTSDYYALAGIFKSTRVLPDEFLRPALEKPLARQAEVAEVERLTDLLAEAEEELAEAEDRYSEQLRRTWRQDVAKYLLAATELIEIAGPLVVEAESFTAGNVKIESEGLGVISFLMREKEPRYAEWTVAIAEAGKFRVAFRYASLLDAFVRQKNKTLRVNGRLVADSILGQETGGFDEENQLWTIVAETELVAGNNTLRLETKGRVPRVDQVALIPVGGSGAAMNERARRVKAWALNERVLDRWLLTLHDVRRLGDPALAIWNAWSAGTFRDGDAAAADEHSRHVKSQIADGSLNVAPVTRALLAGIGPVSRRELAGRYQTLFAAAERTIGRRRFRDREEENGEDDDDAEERDDEEPVNDEESANDERDEEDTRAADGAGEDAWRPLADLLYARGGPFDVSGDLSPFYEEPSRHRVRQLRDRVAAIEAQQPDPLPVAMVTQDADTIGDIPVHIRGSHLTLAKRSTPRSFLRVTDNVLEQPAIPSGTSGRREFADWLTDARHPLTARVMVNRIWTHHFGRGIVSSPSNFGLRGDSPTHPQLLDFLALRFVEGGWSIKEMHRRILLSATYQMSSEYDPLNAAADPENRLLWRMNRQRLQAEPIRDAMLAVSDSLDRELGGRHEGFTGQGYLLGELGSYEEPEYYRTRRRAIYIPVIRTAMYEFFAAFDYADPSVPIGRRPSTVVAPQALMVMNSPFVVEQARRMAERLVTRLADQGRRLEEAFLRAYGRPPSKAEVQQANEFLAHCRSQPRDADEDGELLAWQHLCHVILAGSEFIYVN